MHYDNIMTRKMSKSSLTVDGNNVHMSMPFAKVDEDKRLVSGYATLDNIDSQGDIVLAEASSKAFARARGNIREMHQPIAVGKIVDFREEEVFDTNPVTGEAEFYRGIFVTARVSEGAEDTWKKVLDGTLTGFSIGGEINEASNEFVKEAGKVVRFIKDYDLVELSLVDNPANQLANVMSIQKAADGSTVMKGMVAETSLENVFICSEDETVIVKDTEFEDCPECGKRMENAGWFESSDNRTEKVHAIVTKFLDPSEKEATPSSGIEGGVEMAKEEVTKSDTEEVVADVTSDDEVEEATETESEVETEEDSEEETEESADEESAEEEAGSEEDSDEGTEISKKIDELHVAIKSSLEETKTETAEKVDALEKKIDEATESFLAKASELEGKMSEFGNKLEASKSRLAELENSLEKMNSSDAIRKSADLEESTENNVQKDASWNGAFSGRPRGFSVDDLM